MTCESQPIAEMLVPYVEGTLAEADRLTVTEHLRRCTSCREDVARLREGILAVRGLFGSGYRPQLTRHPSSEDLVAYALEPDAVSEKLAQDLGLHMLECEDCSAEAELLREMSRDLEGRVVPGSQPLLLPRALREELERAFRAEGPPPASREVAPELPLSERLALLLSRFNWRPLLATALAAVVLTLGLLFASSGRNRDLAVKSASAPPLGVAPTPAAPPAAPSQVALAVPPGKAEEVARALDRVKIPYENRDGRLYLSAADLQRARQIVDLPLAEPTLALAPPAAGGASPGAAADAVAKAEVNASPEASPGVTQSASPAASPPQAVAAPSPAPVPSPAQAVAPAPSPAPRRSAAPAPSPTQPRPAAQVAVRTAPPPAAPRTSAPARPAGANEAPPLPKVVAMDGLDSRPRGGGRAAAAAPAETSGEVEPTAPTPALAERMATEESSFGGAMPGTAAKSMALPPEPPPPPPSRSASLETRARQVASEGSVSVEDLGDGSVQVIVRTHRTMTAQEKDALMRRLRRELNLRDTDTITIR